MKNTRAILAAAVLTVLPGATYSQGTPAPRMLFFILSGLPMVRLSKVRFGAGLASATWVLPRRAAMLRIPVTIIC